jgi:chemotaxis protein MotB
MASVENGMGSVSSEGDEIHLQLVDKVLFKLNDDQLTDKGKQVIDKVAAALKEIPDKQIWVQGHTDDQPIFNLAPKPVPVKKGQKPPPVIPPRFATNWELSAARALTVVHYLQDTAKLDPTRLAALAFGQYHPVSKQNKAANRRIEIVLYPKPIVKK